MITSAIGLPFISLCGKLCGVAIETQSTSTPADWQLFSIFCKCWKLKDKRKENKKQSRKQTYNVWVLIKFVWQHR